MTTAKEEPQIAKESLWLLSKKVFEFGEVELNRWWWRWRKKDWYQLTVVRNITKKSRSATLYYCTVLQNKIMARWRQRFDFSIKRNFFFTFSFLLNNLIENDKWFQAKVKLSKCSWLNVIDCLFDHAIIPSYSAVKCNKKLQLQVGSISTLLSLLIICLARY